MHSLPGWCRSPATQALTQSFHYGMWQSLGQGVKCVMSIQIEVFDSSYPTDVYPISQPNDTIQIKTSFLEAHLQNCQVIPDAVHP